MFETIMNVYKLKNAIWLTQNEELMRAGGGDFCVYYDLKKHWMSYVTFKTFHTHSIVISEEFYNEFIEESNKNKLRYRNTHSIDNLTNSKG